MASTIILGSPTVMCGLHPLASNILNILDLLKPKTKFVSFFGSYGWHTQIEEKLNKSSFIKNSKLYNKEIFSLENNFIFCIFV
jgi:flavorubredoxin